jgi:ABC-2 type transport system permease protein
VNTELLKLRTTRAPWAFAAAAVAVGAAIIVLNGVLLGRPGQPPAVPELLADLVRAPGRLTGGIALLIGVLVATSEYRHRTALASRLAQPRVVNLVAGKAAAAAVVGAALASVVVVLMLVGGAAVLASRDVTVAPLAHGLPSAALALVLVAALLGMAGVGIGELVRNPAAAVGVVLGWFFLVEGVLPVVLRAPELDRWLPTGAIRSALEPTAGGLALLALYAAALLVAGALRARMDA